MRDATEQHKPVVEHPRQVERSVGVFGDVPFGQRAFLCVERRDAEQGAKLLLLGAQRPDMSV